MLSLWKDTKGDDLSKYEGHLGEHLCFCWVVETWSLTWHAAHQLILQNVILHKDSCPHIIKTRAIPSIRYFKNFGNVTWPQVKFLVINYGCDVSWVDLVHVVIKLSNLRRCNLWLWVDINTISHPWASTSLENPGCDSRGLPNPLYSHTQLHYFQSPYLWEHYFSQTKYPAFEASWFIVWSK